MKPRLVERVILTEFTDAVYSENFGISRRSFNQLNQHWGILHGDEPDWHSQKHSNKVMVVKATSQEVHHLAEDKPAQVVGSRHKLL